MFTTFRLTGFPQAPGRLSNLSPKQRGALVRRFLRGCQHRPQCPVTILVTGSALTKDGPAVTTDRTVSYAIGAARFAVEAKPRPSSRRSQRDYSRPPAAELKARP